MSELRPRDRSSRIPGIARHGRLPKSRGWAKALGLIGATMAVVLVSASSVAAITLWQFNSHVQDNAVALVGETEGPPPSIGALEGGFNILIVGTDTRAGQGGIGGDEEEETSELNDVNMLLHVSQDQTNAVAISFPRDLVVPIPECPDADGDTKGYSTEALNTALFYGGLPCAVMTIEALTGLPIQFAGMISFNGVIELSNAIGGVPVCVNGPVHDEYTGLVMDSAGTYNLQGIDALAFLRSRHGVGDGSDLTRISSQQVYLSSLVRTLKSSDTLGDFTKVYGLASSATRNMVLSKSLANVDTMVSIALALKNIPLERVTFVQYPGTTGGSGIYAGKVQPLSGLASEMMAKVLADQPFLLEAAGDGRGSEADPNAPVADPNATPDPNAPVIDNTGVEVVAGVRGQTAADYTCSIANN